MSLPVVGYAVSAATVAYLSHRYFQHAAPRDHEYWKYVQDSQIDRFQDESPMSERLDDHYYNSAQRNAEFWTWMAKACPHAPVRPAKPVKPIGPYGPKGPYVLKDD